MDWWNELGAFASFFPGTPPLAVDFAMDAPPGDWVGYGLAYGVQSTPTEFQAYPTTEPGA